MKPFIIAAAALLFADAAGAVEIKVLSTQATEEAYRELVPLFEQASGHKVTTIFTGTLDVQKRIAAGETYDLIIMAGPAIDDFIKSGKVVPGSRVDLARSGVGVAVRAGAPKPDIGSTEALKKTLLRQSRSATRPARAASTSPTCSSASASPTS
jgi:molybdate transport system substrate-binding protein